MKYTILVIALLFITSSFALKLRTSAKQDEAAATTPAPPADPCKELIDFDTLFTSATEQCTQGAIAALIPTPPDAGTSRMQQVGGFSLDTLFAPVQGFIACMEGIMGEGQYTNSLQVFAQLERACAAAS